MLVKPCVSSPVIGEPVSNDFGYFNTNGGYTDLLILENAESGNTENSAYKNTGGTFLCEFTLDALPSSTAALFEVSNQGGDSRITALVRTDGRIQLFSENNDVSQVNINTGSINIGSLNRLAITASENNFASVLNGTTLGTDTNAQYPTSADTFSHNMRIGGQNPLTGNIHSVRYYAQARDTAWSELATG